MSVDRSVTHAGQGVGGGPEHDLEELAHAVVRHVVPERARRRQHGLGVPAVDRDLLDLVPGHRPRRRRLAPPRPAGRARAGRLQRVAQRRRALAQPAHQSPSAGVAASPRHGVRRVAGPHVLAPGALHLADMMGQVPQGPGRGARHAGVEPFVPPPLDHGREATARLPDRLERPGQAVRGGSLSCGGRHGALSNSSPPR